MLPLIHCLTCNITVIWDDSVTLQRERWHPCRTLEDEGAVYEAVIILTVRAWINLLRSHKKNVCASCLCVHQVEVAEAAGCRLHWALQDGGRDLHPLVQVTCRSQHLLQVCIFFMYEDFVVPWLNFSVCALEPRTLSVRSKTLWSRMRSTIWASSLEKENRKCPR